MKTVGLLLATLFLLTSCKKQLASNEIIIEGHVKGVPDGKVYLTEARYWQVHLDSTEVANGYFTFKIKTDSSFVPYKAAIRFVDSSKSTKNGSLWFRNHMLGADSAKYIGQTFYLEKGRTKIEGNNQKTPYLRVFAGKETDLMYEYERIGLCSPGVANYSKRSHRISYLKSKIEQHPFSYFILQSIYSVKEDYSEAELSELLSLFNTDVQKSKLGGQFRVYLANRVDANQPYPDLLLLNSTSQRRKIIDPNAKINMLVFWSSWCGPCRMEIPLLKEIQNKYQSKELNLVSISIDDNVSDWRKALKQETMPWMQCIVDNDKIEMVRQQFNFNAIPLVVFTDKTGKEIARYAGYSKERKNEYEAVIEKAIE